MEQQDPKYIVEIRKGYSVDATGQFVGGEWEVLKDEFGAEVVFDYYFQAHRELKAVCKELDMFGSRVGRVKEVEMVNRRKQQ